MRPAKVLAVFAVDTNETELCHLIADWFPFNRGPSSIGEKPQPDD